MEQIFTRLARWRVAWRVALCAQGVTYLYAAGCLYVLIAWPLTSGQITAALTGEAVLVALNIALQRWRAACARAVLQPTTLTNEDENPDNDDGYDDDESTTTGALYGPDGDFTLLDHTGATRYNIPIVRRPR